MKSIVAAQIFRRPSPRVTGTNPASRSRIALGHRPVDLAGLAGPVVRVAPAEEQAALLEAPVQPGADVEDHRLALDGERLVRLEDRDRVAHGAGRDADAGEPPDRAQAGPPVRSTRSVSIGPASVSTPTTRCRRRSSARSGGP